MSNSSIFVGSGISLIQIILLNSVVCGLEICASAAFTYIPPLLLKAGVSERRMSIILGIGPLFGFLLLPVLGRWSDKCRQFRYGRRRPFIVALSAMLILSLIVLPRYESFGGIYALVISAVLLDFTSQACLTPCEALLVDVSDCAKDETGRLREVCFTVYSVMISAGGCLGYLITAVNWNGSLVAQLFGSQEKSAFSVLAVCFLVLLTVTLAIADERPLTLRRKRSNNNMSSAGCRGGSKKLLATPRDDTCSADSALAIVSSEEGDKGDGGSDVSIGSSSDEDDEYEGVTYGLPMNIDPGYESDSCNNNNCKQTKYHQLVVTSSPGNSSQGHSLTYALSQYLIRAATIFCRSVKRKLKFRIFCPRLPKALSRLAIANYFSWTAVMSFNLFYTDYVGQVVYKGDPNSLENSSSRLRYDEGVRAGSWGLLFHCVTAAVYGCVICRVTRVIGSRNTYFVGMLSFVIATAVMSQSDNVYVVNAMAACTGFAYATLTSVPFLLATMYHSDKQVYYNDVKDDKIIMKKGVASNLATLDSAYYLSQTILSACMGHLVYYTDSVTSYISAACISACVASLCVRRIIVTPADML